METLSQFGFQRVFKMENAQIAPLPPFNQQRAVSLLPRRKYVGELKTRLAAQIDCYGYTYGG